MANRYPGPRYAAPARDPYQDHDIDEAADQALLFEPDELDDRELDGFLRQREDGL